MYIFADLIAINLNQENHAELVEKIEDVKNYARKMVEILDDLKTNAMADLKKLVLSKNTSDPAIVRKYY